MPPIRAVPGLLGIAPPRRSAQGRTRVDGEAVGVMFGGLVLQGCCMGRLQR